MRLHFVVEGQTEETFVRDLLSSELGAQGIFCDAHRVTTRRKGMRAFRGGLVSYKHLRRDLELWMNQDSASDSWFTTMVDLYRLPTDFPGMDNCRNTGDPIKKAECLEGSLASNLNNPRLVPYIQVHEFEALLFSDPASFSIAFPGNNPELAALDHIRDDFKTPEHINDNSAPSKQILSLLPQYDKVSAGLLIAKQIGLTKLRAECHHFNDWINRLEKAGSGNP